MKIQYFTFLFLFIGSLQLHASDTLRIPASMVGQTNKGYIVTLDGKILTGSIGDIFYSNVVSQVIFVNDFGTPYQLRAELISGFVFNEETAQFEYHSVFNGISRSYMQVLCKGKFLKLYKAPEEKTRFVAGEQGFKQETFGVREFWLQVREDRPIEIPRFGYKKKLKRVLWRFPSITKKLGKPGYKYRDLEKIVNEANEIFKQRQRLI